MRDKIIILILVFLLLISFGLVGIFYINNFKLTGELKKLDSLSSSTKKRDSDYTQKNKKYSEIITKYVDGTSFKLGKKSITSSELIRLYNEINVQNLMRADSIRTYKNSFNNLKPLTDKLLEKLTEAGKQLDNLSDSALIYKELFNYSKKTYGFNLYSKKDSIGNLMILSGKISKADSASMLYNNFKNRLKETSPGVYSIDISGGTSNMQGKPPKSKRIKKP